MDILKLEDFVKELDKNNTFIIDDQLCLGSVITRNFENNGIMVLADLNHLKYILREWEINDIIKITKSRKNNVNFYTIEFNSIPSRNIIAYIRNDIETIPAQDCGTDFLKLIDKDIFDDSKSFIVENLWHPIAVIGLDLRKLRLTDKQKCEIAKEMGKKVLYNDLPTKGNPSETLCLVVEIADYSFTFQVLDVNTLELKPLCISDDLYISDKVKSHTKKMVATTI